MDDVRAVIDLAGQRVNATGRLHLARMIPTLIVWGRNDRWIPAADAGRFASAIPAA